MKTQLTAQSVCFDTATGPLFENLSLTVSQGNRIGLIGHNGCGKSTLLSLLWGELQPRQGEISLSQHCIPGRVEQHLPAHLAERTVLQSVQEKLPPDQAEDNWRAQQQLAELGFAESQWALPATALSGGQQTRLLLARALLRQPDLLLLDEPSNHMDLSTLLWLEQFLNRWRGTFVLVSHDQRLLDNVTNHTWIMRDKSIHGFALPCSAARQALEEQDEADEHRHRAEQKEIDRIERSAKRLATWGKVYDNEDLARKAKTMEKRVARLQREQTELSAGSPWRLSLRGENLRADRLLEIESLAVKPAAGAPTLFQTGSQRITSGQRVALLGSNGCGKSSMLRHLWQVYSAAAGRNEPVYCHPNCRVGYYDQTLQQLPDNASLTEALRPYLHSGTDDHLKMVLISAGFSYHRHRQKVAELSGGERARLLFAALSLANYHLLLLDEPTNHLDLQGKEELADALNNYAGGVLLVTHDRELIEQACNAYWVVADGGLKVWHDLQAAYRVFDGGSDEKLSAAAQQPPGTPPAAAPEDTLLEQLIALEAKLAADLQRKTSHQKPKLQAIWQAEIARLKQALNI